VVAGYGCVHVSAIGCGAVLYCAVLLAAYVVVQRVGTVAGSQAGRSESDFRCCKRNDTIRYDTIRYDAARTNEATAKLLFPGVCLSLSKVCRKRRRSTNERGGQE
jgi:hypothetical protein